MSFLINWHVLDDDVRKQAREWLQERFDAIERPAFLGHLRVNELDFGDIPPNIEIRDICDPLPEFYLPDDIDVYGSPTAANLSRLVEAAVSSGRVAADERLEQLLDDLQVAEDMGVAVSSIWLDGLVEDIVSRYVQAMRRESDVEVDIMMEYKGNLRVSFSTELIR
ncbi:Mitochondrial distribution and morphology protein 12 [Cladochytrium tenue]|nr:Mitochondrial distribution and morphology protein 12 [Cladochytrium tenue]